MEGGEGADDSECNLSYHRRRINKEEKAKVVAAVWGTAFIQFFVTLATVFCTRTVLRKRMNSSFSLNHPGVVNPIL